MAVEDFTETWLLEDKKFNDKDAEDDYNLYIVIHK